MWLRDTPLDQCIMSRICVSLFLFVALLTARINATYTVRQPATSKDRVDQAAKERVDQAPRKRLSNPFKEEHEAHPDLDEALERMMVDYSSLSMSLPTSAPTGSDSCFQSEYMCVKLPPNSTTKEVDIFFLFDDTGSFAEFSATVQGIFASLVDDLITSAPDVDFAFGVGRFEDYGGPGSNFSFEDVDGRPFLLNQPIVSISDAGGIDALEVLIDLALKRSAPGFGGDGPEAAIAEGLYQVATGLGFDGDGDGSTTGVDGTQVAGSLQAQTAPDFSGDVPAFSTLDPAVISSGFIGGAGYRRNALKLVIVATDHCSVAAFDSSESLPDEIVGSFSTESTTEYICPDLDRFGNVSDAYSGDENTIKNAVVPKGAGTVPEVVAALNAAGIRVLGLEPENVTLSFLHALARTTGAVDENGDALVLEIPPDDEELKHAMLDAIITTINQPFNVAISVECDSVELLAVPEPEFFLVIPPSMEVCFEALLYGPKRAFTGSCSYALRSNETNLLLVRGDFELTCCSSCLPFV